MKYYSCICGFETSNSGLISNHKKLCITYIKEKQNVIDQSDVIIEQYKKVHSISNIENLSFHEKLGSLDDNFSQITIIVRKILKTAGCYDPYSINSSKVKMKKMKNTMNEKYGVDNISQINCDNLKKRNSIKYKKFIAGEELENYRKLVSLETNRNLKKMILPEYCEYTGIKFDDINGDVNPNSPTKRTIDHYIPIIVGFLNNIPAQDIGSIENIRFCIRYVNSIKGNTLPESFIPIAFMLRERFINEGYEYKKNF